MVVMFEDLSASHTRPLATAGDNFRFYTEGNSFNFFIQVCIVATRT